MQDAACKPKVSLKRSIVSPRQNDNTNNNQFGVSNGNSKINRM